MQAEAYYTHVPPHPIYHRLPIPNPVHSNSKEYTMSQMPRMVRNSHGRYVFESFSIDYSSPDQTPTEREEVGKLLQEYFSKKKVLSIQLDESQLGPKG